MIDNSFLKISESVAKAVTEGAPIVALESTIITHGMPYPQNLETAQSVEQVVRDNGAVPATISIIDGKMCAGLEADDLERLAREGHTAAKASRRDMAAVLQSKKMAGTTVATTMMIAEMAGIEIFATGGIGGVHRGAEETFDISADLQELSRTRVAVVCAGAKSLLDIGKTLEVLESNGVPVIGYGTDAFPAFYVRDSGFPADHRYDSVTDIAEMLGVQWKLGMGGVLIGNPIPQEFEMDAAKIEVRISEAIAEAEKTGVSRKELTPYLLQKIYELTEGESLVANIGLVKSNAAVAAHIAKARADQR